MNHLILGFSFLLLSITGKITGQEVQCGNWSSDEFPFTTSDDYFLYSWSSSLYMPTQIGGSQTMNQINLRLFNRATGYGDVDFSDVHIFLRHTSATEFPNSSHPGYGGGFVEVFDGTFSFQDEGIYTFYFGTGGTSSSFNYNGVDNLEVLIENRGGDDNTYDDPWYSRIEPTPHGHFVGKIASNNSWAKAKTASGARRKYNMAVQFNKSGSICNFPLPVELAFSILKCEQEKITITWQTKSELNNDYFTIEKSLDGDEWNSVKEIKGAGNSSETINYKIQIEEKRPTVVYYRLSQTDYNGTREILNTFSSQCWKEELAVYPNPVKDQISIVSKNGLSIEDITLINALGQPQEISLLKKSFSTGVIDFRTLPKGVYWLKQNGNHLNSPTVKRIVKL